LVFIVTDCCRTRFFLCIALPRGLIRLEGNKLDILDSGTRNKLAALKIRKSGPIGGGGASNPMNGSNPMAGGSNPMNSSNPMAGGSNSMNSSS
jgi:hypothetical protein